MNSIKVVFLILSVFLMNQACWAQKASNKVLADALVNTTSAYPSLGMKILSVEGDKHVLMSNNGRYVIKGTLKDLWEGVDRSFTEINPIDYKAAEKIFEFIERDELSINFGNKDGTQLDIFLSYSCKQCKLLTTQIMKEKFLSRFNVNIFVVYANDLDKKIAEDVFCALNTKDSFIKRFVNRDIRNLEASCSPQEPVMSISYANILPVRSLPATLSYNKNLFYGALPENF
mgnify:CR=1 FL=1